MSIESNLERIATALEIIATGGEVPAPKAKGKSGKAAASEASSSSKAKSTSAPAETPSEQPNAPKVTDVRKTLGQVQKAFSPDKAREILKEVGGAAVMSKVPVGKYSAIIAAANALLSDAN